MGLFFQHGVSLGIMAPHALPAAARLTDHERRLTPCDSIGRFAGRRRPVRQSVPSMPRARQTMPPPARPAGPEADLNCAPVPAFHAQEVAGYERELDKLVLPGEFRALTEHPRLQLQACRLRARADGGEPGVHADRRAASRGTCRRPATRRVSGELRDRGHGVIVQNEATLPWSPVTSFSHDRPAVRDPDVHRLAHRWSRAAVSPARRA